MVRKKIGKVTQKVLDINDAFVSNYTPPTELLRTNMLWIDNTNPSARVLKQYNGQSWVTLSYDFETNIPVNSDKDIEDYVLTIGNVGNDSKINYYERIALSSKFKELTGLTLTTTFPTFTAITTSTNPSLIKTVYDYASGAGVSTANLQTRYNEFKTHMETYTNPRITDTTVSNKFLDTALTSVSTYRSTWVNLIVAMRDASTASETYWQNYNNSVKNTKDASPNENMLRNSDFYLRDNITMLPVGAWKDFYKNNPSGTTKVVDISTDLNNLDYKNAYRLIGATGSVVGIQNALVTNMPSVMKELNGKRLTFSGYKKATGATGSVICRVVVKGKNASGTDVSTTYTLSNSASFIGTGTDSTFTSVVGTNSANIVVGSDWTEYTGVYFDLYFIGTGSLDLTGLKLEVGTQATKWIPNPLDFDTQVGGSTFSITPEGITSMVFNSSQWSQISQKANRIDIVVGADGSIKGEDIASAISLTPSAITLISESIDLTGKVTFYDFEDELQESYSQISLDALAANATAQNVNDKVIGLGLPNSTTTINGGNIQTGTMSANVINTGTLNSIQINNGNGAFTVSPTGAMTASNAIITSTQSGVDDETDLSATNYVEIGNGRVMAQQYGGSTNSTQTITMSGNSGLQFRTSKNANTNLRIDVYESESTSTKGVFKIHARGSQSELRILSDGDLVLRADNGKVKIINSLEVTSQMTVQMGADFLWGVSFLKDVTMSGTLGVSGVVVLLNEIQMVSSGIIRGATNEIHLAGRMHESHTYGHLRVTSTSNGGFVQSESIVSQTTTSSANMYIQSSGHIKMTSSSIRYKINIEEQTMEKSKALLNIVPKTWHDKVDSERYADYLTKKSNGEDVDDAEWQQCSPIRRIGGLIAEEIAEAGLKEFVFYEDDGVTPQGLMYDRIWTLLIPIVKEHEEKLDSMQRKIDELQAVIDSK